MKVLAIDQGTTSTRAMLFSPGGDAEVICQLEHRQYYPGPGRVEHDPEELIRNIQACIDHCDRLLAIGIDNQGESCLAWDAKTKQAISPVIVWQDNRTAEQISKLAQNGADRLVRDTAGLPLDSYFSASKLAWILENISRARELEKQGRLRLGTTDAFFLDRLLGRFVTDITTASRTSLLNLQAGQWDPELCQLFGVPMECLPEIVSTTGEFGAIRHRNRDTCIMASLVDQQASLYGHGCRNAGDCKITFGTGAFALCLTGADLVHPPDQSLLPTVAWQLGHEPPVYALDGGIYCAGSAMNWARSLGLFNDFDEINAFDAEPAVERNLVFVPALAGLASPHWDRSAAGLWLGMSLDTTAKDLVQSILEGIAFRSAEVMQAMQSQISARESISIDGGVSSNPYFCQFLADVLGVEVRVQAEPELTALGTALLAAGIDDPVTPHSYHDKRYAPARDRTEGFEKFRTAVARSKNWN